MKEFFKGQLGKEWIEILVGPDGNIYQAWLLSEKFGTTVAKWEAKIEISAWIISGYWVIRKPFSNTQRYK